MARDMMIDIETLATTEDAVVLQIGAVLFDPEVGSIMDPMLWNLDVVAQQGRAVDAETVLWWAQQSGDAVTSVLGISRSERVLPATALRELRDVLENVRRVWARGPNFDLSILNHLWSQHNDGAAGGPLIKWHKWRDERPIRDLIGAVGVGTQRTGTAHNALDDATNQAQNVLQAYRLMQKRGAK